MNRRIETPNLRFRPSRRGFCSGIGAALGAGATIGASPLSMGRARGGGAQRDTVVLLYLRGGLDGLSACIPLFEAGALQGRRPGLLVPTTAASGAVDLDGSFALHPSLAPLEPMFRDGELSIVHAVGSLDPTRSHFAARRAIEAGAVGPLVQGAQGGWIGRALGALRELGPVAPRGVALGAVLPRLLQRGPRVIPVQDPSSFADYGDSSTAGRRRAALDAMHRRAQGAPGSASIRTRLAHSGLTTVAALDVLGAIDFGRAAAPTASYPNSVLGGRLKDAATLVLEDVGTDVIQVETGDFDDHDDMGPVSGDLAARLDDLARGLAAFRRDLGAAMARTTVLVYSEFGRKVPQNGSRGTDHGRGGVALALGGGVLGGRVLGNWPGLGPADLDDDALAVTTDIRDLFGEALQRRLGVPTLGPGGNGEIFPGYQPRSIGLFS